MEAPALRFDIPKSQSDVEKNGFSIWGIYGNPKVNDHFNMGNIWVLLGFNIMIHIYHDL